MAERFKIWKSPAEQKAKIRRYQDKTWEWVWENDRHEIVWRALSYVEWKDAGCPEVSELGEKSLFVQNVARKCAEVWGYMKLREEVALKEMEKSIELVTQKVLGESE